MKHFNVKGINYIAVEVPEGKIIDLRDYYLGIKIIKVIGTTPLSEEQCREIVEKNNFGCYWDYFLPRKRLDYMCRTACQSFLTLLDREGITGKNVIIKVEKQNGNKRRR